MFILLMGNVCPLQVYDVFNAPFSGDVVAHVGGRWWHIRSKRYFSVFIANLVSVKIFYCSQSTQFISLVHEGNKYN